MCRGEDPVAVIPATKPPKHATIRQKDRRVKNKRVKDWRATPSEFLNYMMDPILTTSLIIIGIILALAGFVGCILPILPGPPLGFLALLLLSFTKNWEPFSTTFLVVMGILTALVTVLDYLVPAAGAKKYGASKFGVWGSLAGLVIGFFFFPPFGMFVGGFVGAVAGELLAGRAGRTALRAGWGVFVGNLFGMGLKLGLSGVMLFFYIKEMF